VGQAIKNPVAYGWGMRTHSGAASRKRGQESLMNRCGKEKTRPHVRLLPLLGGGLSPDGAKCSLEQKTMRKRKEKGPKRGGGGKRQTADRDAFRLAQESAERRRRSGSASRRRPSKRLETSLANVEQKRTGGKRKKGMTILRGGLRV